jgi:hypothetical protein
MFASISPPKTRSEHEMADYIEILCLVNKDHEIDASTAAHRVYEESDLDVEADDSRYDLKIEYEDTEVEPYGSDSDDAQLEEDPNDSRNNRANDWFLYLQSRQKLYTDFYPFIVEHRRIRRKGKLSENNRLYIYLLLSSNLRVVQRENGGINTLTTDFERLCEIALREYLPGFYVKRCGKSLDNSSDVPSKLVDMIEYLAGEMNEPCVLTDEYRQKIGDRNTGDGGLDVLAYRRPHEDDIAEGSLIVFGQCACGDNWIKKKREASAGEWGQRINFFHPPATVLFIPYGFRDSQGRWARPDILSGCILMDRLRICRLLTGQGITNLQSSQIVEELIGFSEDI